jgi:hypothetical protein
MRTQTLCIYANQKRPGTELSDVCLLPDITSTSRTSRTFASICDRRDSTTRLLRVVAELSFLLVSVERLDHRVNIEPPVFAEQRRGAVVEMTAQLSDTSESAIAKPAAPQPIGAVSPGARYPAALGLIPRPALDCHPVASSPPHSLCYACGAPVGAPHSELEGGGDDSSLDSFCNGIRAYGITCGICAKCATDLPR